MEPLGIAVAGTKCLSFAIADNGPQQTTNPRALSGAHEHPISDAAPEHFSCPYRISDRGSYNFLFPDATADDWPNGLALDSAV